MQMRRANYTIFPAYFVRKNASENIEILAIFAISLYNSRRMHTTECELCCRQFSKGSYAY